MKNNYLELYRRRVFQHGETEKDRLEKNLELDFDSYLSRSPGKVSFFYKDNEYEGVLISGTRTAAQSETKIIFYLRGRKNELLPEGAIIKYYDKTYSKDRYWVVLNAEVKSFYGYIQYKIIELDYLINYVDTNGVVQNIPVYIIGTTTFDIKEYFKFADTVITQLPNRAVNLITSSDFKFDQDSKIIIGEEVWRFVGADTISIPGVTYATFDKTQLNKQLDSVKEQVANINKIGTTKIISNYGENKISIGLETIDLSFSLLRDGIKQPSNFEYEVFKINFYDDPIIEIQGDKIIPIAEGICRLKVIDKISRYSEEKVLEIAGTVEQPLNIVGDRKVVKGESVIWELSQDLPLKEYPEDKLQIVKTGTFVNITGLKVGSYKIIFGTEERNFTFDIKVIGEWMV